MGLPRQVKDGGWTAGTMVTREVNLSSSWMMQSKGVQTEAKLQSEQNYCSSFTSIAIIKNIFLTKINLRGKGLYLACSSWLGPLSIVGKLGQELEVAIHSYNKAQKETEYTCLLAQLSVVFFFFHSSEPKP